MSLQYMWHQNQKYPTDSTDLSSFLGCVQLASFSGHSMQHNSISISGGVIEEAGEEELLQFVEVAVNSLLECSHEVTECTI